MNDTILTQVQDQHQLEMLLLKLQRQTAENEAALRQAKCDLREAKVAEAEYAGSFRCLRDKLTGKREESETALRHNVQKAEAALASATQTAKRLSLQTEEVQSRLEKLPSREDLRAQGLPEWHRLEALYCMEVLAPMLEANQELLTARRNQFNGSNAGQVKSHQTLAEIYTAPEAAGEACKPYLLRLKEALDALGISISLPEYWENPTAFLSYATQYTRMDRVNKAISQVAATQRLLSGLLKQLEA